jgi:hypothetical protein
MAAPSDRGIVRNHYINRRVYFVLAVVGFERLRHCDVEFDDTAKPLRPDLRQIAPASGHER